MSVERLHPSASMPGEMLVAPSKGQYVRLRDYEALRDGVGELLDAVARHRELKLPGGIDLIDKRLYEDSRRAAALLDDTKGEGG